MRNKYVTIFKGEAMAQTIYIIKNAKLRKFLLFLLIFVGVMGICDTMLLIPVTSSITLGMIAPTIIGIVLIAIGTLNLTKSKPIFKNKTLLKVIALSLTAGILFFSVIEAFIWAEAAADDKDDTQANFVIVLGCGIFPDGRLTLSLKKRLDAAYDYMQMHPMSVCVVSGGQGSNEPLPEGEAMAQYLLEKGIDESRILTELYATSTKQNLKYSYEIINEAYPQTEKTVAIVSSEFHMFRVKFLAKRYGMDAIGIPSPTAWYILPNCMIREFFAVIKSFFLDK